MKQMTENQKLAILAQLDYARCQYLHLKTNPEKTRELFNIEYWQGRYHQILEVVNILDLN